MNGDQKCTGCGQSLPPDAPAGHCPKCLVQLAIRAADGKTTIGGASPVTPAASASLNSLRVKYFGDYEIVEEIARGGMGVVWKARQVSLNRPVALKMILAGRFASDADVRRFYTEAEAAANLQHPHIVAIHEVGQHEGQHYYSMDYVEGKNLAEVVEGSPMPVAQAALIVKKLAETVHYAHQRGTLHRDLKPSNVLIDAEGQPRITDFGLAKQISRDSGLTQSGAVLGTPAYMPPEQATGRLEEVGPASDVYSLGAILYQMLTGRAPFSATSPLQVIQQVLETDPVAPSKLNAKTPPDLETICLKCLEKAPERRYHSARDLAEELGRFLSHEPIFARPASSWRKAWSWSARNPWAIIGVAALGCILLLGLAYGLWERVKFLEGGTPPKTNFWRFFPSAIFRSVLIWFIAMLYGRWLNSRRRQNLPVSNLQLAMQATGGFLLITNALWTDVECIRLHVWQSPDLDSLAELAAICLGWPLVFCWIGGIMMWQSIRRQQAQWSGVSVTEEEWMPRQARHYSTPMFVLAIFLNLVLFVLLPYLGIVTGLFDGFLNVVGRSREGKIMLISGFGLIGLGVSYACWVYATRHLYKRPLLVSIFLVVLLLGAAIGWFSAPPYSLLPASFVLTAILAGLVGGGVLLQLVKIKKGDQVEAVTPIEFGELFHCDGRAFAITLAITTLALGALTGLFSGVSRVPFFVGMVWPVWNALLPLVFIGLRATTGNTREFFLSVLLGMVLLNAAFAIGIPLADKLGIQSTLFLHWVTTVPAGLAGGCALIYFGKIRPRLPDLAANKRATSA